MSMIIWARSRDSDTQEWALTPGCPRELLFGNVVETKVVGFNKISLFYLCPDVHDHLGEVQSLGHPGVGH